MSQDEVITLNPERRNGSRKTIIVSGFVALVILVLLATGFHWTVNRVYIRPGESVQLTYKGPLVFGSIEQAELGQFAKVDENGIPLQRGILEQMLGPGRHFYCPIWWSIRRVPDVSVEPGEVGIAKSNLGGKLPAGEYLVDGDLGETQHKGVLRKTFGPGLYRVNPYAYAFKVYSAEKVMKGNRLKHFGWVEIPTGYVGVVTNLTANQKTGTVTGIQDKVLPPGLYPVNKQEKEIDIVEVGFREKSVAVAKKVDQSGALVLDKNGEPQLAAVPGGISFPSNDGFEIFMDFTAIWGIMPDQAAAAVREYGNTQEVEDKVVVPQIESICRNVGSKFAAVELLVGGSRQQFQQDTSDAFEQALDGKDVTLKQGLVRYIFIPQEVRAPIQMGYIADELKLTRDQEILTARTEANLREAERIVELEAERVTVDTQKMVAKVTAEGQKTAEETRAKTTQLVAAIDKETADLESQATVVLGKADAGARKMLEEAKADKFRLAVAAFGSGEAYNQWVFASGLPEDIQLRLLYAGEGTFWTDLKGLSETLLGRQVQRENKKP